jgi:hypothetical protein
MVVTFIRGHYKCFVTTSGRSGAPKALRTAAYDGTIIYNDPVLVILLCWQILNYGLNKKKYLNKTNWKKYKKDLFSRESDTKYSKQKFISDQMN